MSREIKEMALREIEHLEIDNLYELNCTDRFTDFYESNQNFYQVCFYDRTKEYSGRHYIISVDEGDKNKLLSKIKTYNDNLEYVINKYGKKNFSFTDVGDSIGYCFINVFERNKAREEEKQRSYDFDEVSCSSCGDGGCVHCEPHRFIDGPIY